jgi:hypothetical protein
MTRAARWNRRALLVFGPVLVLAGALGFVIPPSLALMSGVTPYNLFHIAFGILGTAIAVAGRPRPIAAFNLGFGAIDLWQAVAGFTKLPPSALFALRPADHVVHILFGAALVGLGARGFKTPPLNTPPPG